MPYLMTGAPQITLVEKTLSTNPTIAVASGAMVFGSPTGPTVPTFCANWPAFTNLFGGSQLNWGFAGISAKAYLNSGPGLWCQRVISDDAYYASSFILFDTEYGYSNPANINNVYIGDSLNFSQNNEAVSGFTIKSTTENFPAGTMELTLNISGLVNTTVTVNINLSASTSSAEWFAGIVSAISSQLSNTGAITEVFGSSPICNGYITSPTGNCFLYFTQGLIVSATVSGVGAAITNDPFIQVYASNPTGTFANNTYGTSVSSFSTGQPQVTTIYFNEDLVAGDVVSLQFAIGAKTYNVAQQYNSSGSSSAAITSLAAQISAISTGTDISFNAVASSYANNGDTNLITVTASQSGVNSFSVYKEDSLNYTLSTISNGQADPETFTFNTWNISNTNSPIESFLVSLNTQVDANGSPQNITTVINGGSSQAPSNYITAYVGNSATYDPSVNGISPPVLPANPIGWLNGGSDGSLPTNGAIAEAWDVFSDTETYSLNLLINAGYTDPSIQAAMSALADDREDCIAILDVPSSYVTSTTVANYRNSSINTVSSRSAIYTPYVQTVDPTTMQNVWAPPSGFVADRFAYTRSNYGNYLSPAGSTYGVIANATKVAVNYENLSDRNILAGAQVNYIRIINGALTIDNDMTAINNNGMLSSLNVRIMVNDIETYAKALANNYKFVLDNPSTWTTIQSANQKNLDIYINAGALNPTSVAVCDGTNNTPIYMDNAQINCNLYLIPYRATRYLYVGVGIGTNTIGIAELEASGIV